MARVLYGALVTDLQGSVGGSTFQKCGAAASVRSKPAYKPFPTQLQLNSQAMLAYIANYWQSCTPAQQSTWGPYAALHPITDAFGRTRVLSGYAYFVMVNSNLSSVNSVMLRSAPVYAAPVSVPPFTISATSATFVLNLGFSSLPANHRMLIFASPPNRSRSVFNVANKRFLQLKLSLSSATYSIKVEYETVFNVVWPSFFTNSKCAIAVSLVLVRTDNGLASPLSTVILEIG